MFHSFACDWDAKSFEVPKFPPGFACITHGFATARTGAAGCIAIGPLTPALAPDFVTVPPTTSSFAADSIE
jgi:hypothetical protein